MKDEEERLKKIQVRRAIRRFSTNFIDLLQNELQREKAKNSAEEQRAEQEREEFHQ